MLRPFDPGERPTGLGAWLGEIPETLFDDRIYVCCELVERYATDLALALVGRLGLAPALAAGATAEEMLAAGGFVAAFQPALTALLDRLAEAGYLARQPRGRQTAWRAVAALPAPEFAELRRLGATVDPRVGSTLDLLDAAAEAFPKVASGVATGEQELFSAGRIALWLAYFSNDNPAYALNNRLTAAVATHRLRPGDGLRILEVGAGAGSFAHALLGELERRGRLGDVALYDFTEPSPFFRRRGERELRAAFPGLALRSRAVDIDAPLADPTDAGTGYDLIVGVNVFHVARDLGASLGRAREALVPGGWLLAGECMRLFPGQTVPADLVFQLLRSFTDVQLDAAARPHHGFLEPGAWRRAFELAGFADAAVVPDLERIRDRYPRFLTGVVAGRRAA
jgi:SAM-dependent methyltransferase